MYWKKGVVNKLLPSSDLWKVLLVIIAFSCDNKIANIPEKIGYSNYGTAKAFRNDYVFPDNVIQKLYKESNNEHIQNQDTEVGSVTILYSTPQYIGDIEGSDNSSGGRLTYNPDGYIYICVKFPVGENDALKIVLHELPFSINCQSTLRTTDISYNSDKVFYSGNFLCAGPDFMDQFKLNPNIRYYSDEYDSYVNDDDKIVKVNGKLVIRVPYATTKFQSKIGDFIPQLGSTPKKMLWATLFRAMPDNSGISNPRPWKTWVNDDVGYVYNKNIFDYAFIPWTTVKSSTPGKCATKRVLFHQLPYNKDDTKINLHVGGIGLKYLKDENAACDFSKEEEVFAANSKDALESNVKFTLDRNFFDLATNQNISFGECIEEAFRAREYNLGSKTCEPATDFNTGSSRMKDVNGLFKFNILPGNYDIEPQAGRSYTSSWTYDHFGKKGFNNRNFLGKQRVQNGIFNLDVGLNSGKCSPNKTYDIINSLYKNYFVDADNEQKLKLFRGSVNDVMSSNANYDFLYFLELYSDFIDGQTDNFLERVQNHNGNGVNDIIKGLHILYIDKFALNTNLVSRSGGYYGFINSNLNLNTAYKKWMDNYFESIVGYNFDDMNKLINLPFLMPFVGKTSPLTHDLNKISDFYVRKINVNYGRVILISKQAAKHKFIEHTDKPFSEYKLREVKCGPGGGYMDPLLCNNEEFTPEIKEAPLFGELMIATVHEIIHGISDYSIFNLSGGIDQNTQSGNENMSSLRQHVYLCSGDGCYNCIYRPQTKLNINTNGTLNLPNDNTYKDSWMNDDDFVNNFSQHARKQIVICENHRNLLMNLQK